eukprot:scaffold101392_cov67-Phaeocystis_antarctica.AAC.2
MAPLPVARRSARFILAPLPGFDVRLGQRTAGSKAFDSLSAHWQVMMSTAMRTAVTPPSAVSAYPTSSGGGNGSSGRMATTRAATATRSSTRRTVTEKTSANMCPTSGCSDISTNFSGMKMSTSALWTEERISAHSSSCPRADEQVRRLHEERDDRQHDVDDLAHAHDRAQPARGGVDLAPVHDEREKVCDRLQPVPEDELDRCGERGRAGRVARHLARAYPVDSCLVGDDDVKIGQPFGLGLRRKLFIVLGLVLALAGRARHHHDEQHGEWARKREHDGHVCPCAEVGGVLEQEVEQGASRGCAGEDHVPRWLGLKARHLPQHCEGLSE